MDVRPVGGGPVETGLTQGAGMAAPVVKLGQAAVPGTSPAATAVIDAAILSLLSQPDIARLVVVLEPGQSQNNSAQLAELLQASITAATTGDLAQALESIAAVVTQDPGQAEAVRNDPGLAPVRAQAEALLTRMANIARLDAETRVGEATRAVEGGGVKTLPNWEARPEALLSIAGQLLAAGGHVNAVRAAQVAQVVIDASHWAPTEAAQPLPIADRAQHSDRAGDASDPILPSFFRSWALLRKHAAPRIANLWRRAPLLVLLLGWLGVGLAGGLASWVQRKILPDAVPDGLTDTGFTIWGLGFVALVLVGFYVRVRNVRL